MLDPSGRQYVLEAVRRLNREEGITIILITHYMEEAVLADRVIILEKGQIARDSRGELMDGTPVSLFSRVEELKKLSLDVPAVTELAVRLKKRGLDIPAGILTRQELADCLKRCMREAGLC